MFFQQYVLGCLSQLSYLVGDGSTGRAVVVDPHRYVSVYLRDANERDMRIERVIETHVHADFLSGHLELAALGASICYGERARADFDIESLADGQRIDLSEVQLEILATPGHTPESISVVMYEHRDSAAPFGVLTGDALLIGDVGRPDLLGSAGLSADQLARQLWVFPAHAVAACLHDRHTGRSARSRTARVNNGYDPVKPSAATSSNNVVAHRCGSAAGRNRQYSTYSANRSGVERTRTPGVCSPDRYRRTVNRVTPKWRAIALTVQP